MYRADDESRRYGDSGVWDRTCRIGLAVSSDGRRFTRHPEPVIFPDNDAWKTYEWEGGCEDIHIIEDEAGTYFVNYTAWNGIRDTLCVASSRDLVHWNKHGTTFGKGWEGETVGGRREGERLIVAKINGKCWMYWHLGPFSGHFGRPDQVGAGGRC